MKPSSNYTNPNPDQNWQWPEKTWFRERLNALKARESEERRKPLVASEPNVEASKPTTAKKSDSKSD